MPHVFTLPTNTTQAEEAIANLVLQGRDRRNPQAIKWLIANYYLQGIRQFSTIDYQSGTVTISYLDQAGILKFRYEEIVAKYQSQMGRLLGLDLSPTVRKKGISLDGMRKASVAQVVLDAALPQDKIDEFELDLLPPLLMYGTVGVGLWIEGSDSHGLEVIPPWQLIPLPLDVAGPTDVRGLMRVRPVPMEWLKNLQITPGGKKKVYKAIDNVGLPVGSIPTDIDGMGDGLVAMTATGGGFFVHSGMNKDAMDGGKQGKGKKDEKNIPITQLVEVWTETSDGHLAEYRIYAGMSRFKELYKHDHTENKYHMPVRVIRDVTVGSFWGRSYVDQMIPLNNELEIALSSVFQSVSDFDLYGLLMWPSSLGVPPLARRGQDGLKTVQFDPDYSVPETKPFSIEPAKMTAPQLQAVQLASGLMDKVANQPAKIMSGEAPGRTDSAAAIGTLYEASGIPLSPTAKSIAGGVSGLYRALLRILKDTWTDKKVVSISNLDDSLAGIVIDAEAGTMQLSQNAIPFPDEVSVTVASEVPVSMAQQKAELKEALAEQRITLDEFNWDVRKKGLDIPVGGEVEYQNYRRAMLENILLFNDGETPGKEKIIVTDRDIHRIHELVLNAFMARPEFFKASQAVRDAFAKHWEEHKYSQASMPEQMEYPEDAAAEALQAPMQMGGQPE